MLCDDLIYPCWFRMRAGQSEEYEVHPDRGHGYPVLTNQSLEGEFTGRGIFYFPHNVLSFQWQLRYLLRYLQNIDDSGDSGFFFFSRLMPFFEGMTTRSTNLASATTGTTTSITGVTSTGEITSILSFTTSHWGRGNERRRRNGMSRERALMGVHLRNKATVSLCLQRKPVKTTWSRNG